jgi:hypothetical protein
MQADFSRTTFDPARHFSAVLAQQGRVQLDADFNEQAAILLHQLRTAVADIVGPAGAPAGSAGGFVISAATGKAPNEDLAISPGRMYVDGVLVENAAATTYWGQPDGYLDPAATADALPQQSPFVVYLRVWERLITAVQDPSIREIALGDHGPDTAARAKTVWQVAAHPVTATDVSTAVTELGTWVESLTPTGQLRAGAKQPPDAAEDPCHLPPESRFRGPENQLYRVEVHTGGHAWPSAQPTTSQRGQKTGRETLAGATFKWSRENASVVFPILSISGAVVELAALGRDGKLDLEVGDWVELVDDATANRVADDVPFTDPPQSAPRLRKVLEIDAMDRRVTLDRRDDEECALGPHPVLRRWDHAVTHIGTTPVNFASDGAVPISEGRWIDLEDGVQVFFQANDQAKGAGSYRRGDYWLVPARTATGDVIWPADENGAAAQGPNGVEYHYTPLAFVSGTTVDASPRHTFTPLTPSPAAAAETPVAEPTSTSSSRPLAKSRTTTSARRKPSGTGTG